MAILKIKTTSDKVISDTSNVAITDAIKEFKGKVINDIDDLLRFCTENGCSDLYITVGKKPYISKYGKIYMINCLNEINKNIWNIWATRAITNEMNSNYVVNKMLDLSYQVESKNGDIYRYRVSAGYSQSRNIATFRMISSENPSFSNINFPKDIASIISDRISYKNNIIMICGPTGSGKTTTFAACINDFSKDNGPLTNSIIVSLEDPIEYLYASTDNMSITQKELGRDFKQFSLGVKQALREHPNFINVGETRDKETIGTLVEASRTGHAVMTSFHSSNIADTISRLYNYLNKDNNEIMYDLISNMNMILCQKLIPSDTGFKIKIQYLIFTNEIIDRVNKAIINKENIPMFISSLLKDEELLKEGIIKDW